MPSCQPFTDKKRKAVRDFLILMLFRLFHREGNTTARDVYGKHPHGHNVANLQNIGRVTHELSEICVMCTRPS